MLLFFFLALSVGLITLDFRQNEGGVLENARELSAAVVAPVQRGFAAVFRPVGNLFSSVGELGSLRSDNARLEAQVADLETRINEAESLAEENATLRAELELDESWASMDRVAAETISKVPSNYRWAYTIDKGREDGIRRDMSVINSDGLVGKIIEVDTRTSTVLLLIDPSGGAGAKIEGKGHSGFLSGNGAGENLSLEFIRPEARVVAGDRVVTSFFNEGIFPPNIPIGLVASVEGASAALEQKIEVEPYADFTSLEVVQVLLESGPKLSRGRGE